MSSTVRLRLTTAIAVTLCLGTLIGLETWTAPAARADDVDDAFREGVSAYEQNDYDTARQRFEFVLSRRPSDEKARLYRDEAGFRFWIDVLSQRDNLELATIARKILQLAERASLRERQDPETIREALSHLESEDFVEQHEWFERIISVHGHYVVPFLVDALGDSRRDQFRVDAIRLLSKLGGDGVLAMLEILDSEDAFTRQNTCVVLGNMRDFRAVPALRRAAEEDSDEHVRSEARAALGKFFDPAKEAPPQEHYLRLAEAYYSEEPLVMVNNYKEWVIWKWQDGKLTYRDVSRHSWNEQIAEELAYDALALDAEFDDAWVLLLNVYFQEWNEVTSALDVASQKSDEGQMSSDDVATLRDAQKVLEKASMICSSRGSDLMFQGLRRALIDRNSLVAVSFIEALRDLNVSDSALPDEGVDLSNYLHTAGDETPLQAAPPAAEPPAESAPTPQPAPVPTSEPEAEPGTEPESESAPRRRRPRRRTSFTEPPTGGREYAVRFAPADSNPDLAGLAPGAALCAALEASDKRVRYHAAQALVALDPAKRFANIDLVVANLADAVSESGARVVLVVERDQNIRNRTVGLLREFGYVAHGVNRGLEGINRARAFPAQDLIIVSTELNVDAQATDLTEVEFIDRLREGGDYRTSHIPVMILTTRRKQSEKQALVDEGDAVGLIHGDIDRAILKDRVAAVFETDRAKRDEKARADRIAQFAAEALASIDPKHSIFDAKPAIPALTEALHARPDQVRTGALAALGNLKATSALPEILAVFNNLDNDRFVRIVAAAAIGEIIKDGPVSDATFKSLLAALGEDDKDIWTNAGRALGKGQLTGDQSYEVFVKQRIQ